MRRTVGLLPLLLPLAFLVAGASAGHVSLREGPLERWLANLTLTIPMPKLQKDFSVFGVKIGSVDLELNKIVCKGIKISKIFSHYYKNESSIKLNLAGVGVACDIPNFAAHLDGVSIGSGQGTASVYDSTVVDKVQITGSDGLATKASNTECSTNIKTKVHLNLSAFSRLVNLIISWVEGEIDKKIDEIICQTVGGLVGTNLTNALLSIDRQIKPLMPPECCAPFQPPSVPEGVINWRDSGLVDVADFVLDYLVGPAGPISINKIMNQLTANTGVLSLQTNISVPVNASKLGASLELGLQKVTIGGLNQFESLDFLRVSTDNAHVLNTSISSGMLNVTIEAYIKVTPDSSTIQGDTLMERFKLNIELLEPDLELKTLLAVYKNRTLDLEMGQLLMPECLAEALYAVNFTQISLNFTLGNLKLAADGGDVESELDSTVDNILNLFIDQFATVVPDVLHGAIMRPVTKMLNEGLYLLQKSFSSLGCGQPKVSADPFVDWENGTLADAFTFLDGFIGPSGPLSINWIMQQLLGADSDGYAVKHGQLAAFKVQDNLKVSIRDLAFHGVMSFANFSIFNPIDSRSLLSYVDWAKKGGPVNISFWVDTLVTDSSSVSESRLTDVPKSDSFRIEIHVSNFSLRTTGEFLVNKTTFSRLHLRQMGNAGCLATSLKDGEFRSLYMSADDTHFRLSGGHSDGIHRIEKALPSFDKLSIELFNYLYDVGAPFVETEVNHLAAKTIADSSYLCSGEEVPSESKPQKKWYEKAEVLGLVIGSGSFVIISTLLWLACRRTGVIKKYQDNGYRQLNEGGRTTLMDADFSGEERKHDSAVSTPIEPARLFPPWTCLASNPHIPLVLRFGIPLILAANIACFVVSNTGVGAAVKLKLNVGEISPDLPTLFEFNLANTVRDMWKAGVYPLSILVAVFSGGWPYLKLVLMEVCWLFPIEWLPERRRESLLIALDALGKWSLIDSYVLSLMLVAFHFELTNPKSEIPTKFFSADVIVEPGLGFYTFLLGTIASLLTTHIVLHYHRFNDASKAIVSGGEKEALCNHMYSGEAYGLDRRHRVRCSMFGKLLVTFLLLLGLAVVLAGSIIESFNFEFKGLASLFLGDEATRGYSLLSVTHSIPQSAENPKAVGVIWIQAVFYTVSFAVPLAHLVVMMFLWWVPMTAKTQYGVFYFTEILNAWSALDVFVVSIMAAILEIQQFAEFLVGDKCDAIDAFLKQYVTQYLGGYNTCFTVIATLSDGCWVLFFAAVISLSVAQTVMRTCHKAIHDRLDQHSRDNTSGENSFNNSGLLTPKEEAKGTPAMGTPAMGTPTSRPEGCDGLDSETEHSNGCLQRIGEFFTRVGLLKILDDVPWVRYVDQKSNCAYYKNQATGEVTWTKPPQFATDVDAVATHDVTIE